MENSLHGRSPLGAEILALPMTERVRLAARLIEDDVPEMAMLLLAGVLLDLYLRQMAGTAGAATAAP